VDGTLRGLQRGRHDGGEASRVDGLAGDHRRRAADEAMTAADQLVERGAERLHKLSEKAAARGGAATKVAEELSDDAEFVRKLKPSLISQRVRGHEPAEPEPRFPPVVAKRREGGPNPLTLAAAALAAGTAAAKLLDWRGHAHPRG
jgi:hypothetical protein